MGIFDERVAFKPFEYPDVSPYKDAINHSYWLVSEWNFIGDIQDFKTLLTDTERAAITKTLLAISQIEVSVKRFWTQLGTRMPKPEFEQVGVTFGESEVRHADAYSHLLEVLGLNREFDTVLQNEAILKRVQYLGKYLKGIHSQSNEEFSFALALFSIFIENVSLFSQFVIIKSFNKYNNRLKDIDNVVQATQKEELIHAMFGSWLINAIRDENPTWFDDAFTQRLHTVCREVYEAECGIVDWIFSDGELEFLPKQTVKEFIKNRLNSGLAMINIPPAFTDIDPAAIKALQWFEEEIYSDVNSDFFYKRPVTYSKMQKPITDEDLF